jgi:4-amino-4-deoxy-L-arabinose transferase-like glycosyltransferase
MRGGRHSDLICISFIVGAWIFAVLAIGPVGNFPLNDDWAYASAVRALVEQGEIRLSGWTATNLITQLLWGSLFCLPFGFSFTALRISTLVLAMLGIVSTYALLREAHAKPGTALIGALVLAFGPIYFALSFTFMTDVPFTAVATASSWLLLRGLRRGGRAAIVAGLALAMAAVLIRQIGLAIPIAFALAYLAKRRLGFWRLIEAAIPVLAGAAVQTAYQGWLRWLDRVPAKFGDQITTLRTQLSSPWPTIAGDCAKIIFCTLLYTGLLLSPFLIIAHSADLRSRQRNPYLYCGGVGAMAALATIILKIHGSLMPLHGNVLTKGGVDWYQAPAPSWFWLLVTFFSCLGAIMLVAGPIRGGFALLAPTRSGFEAREPFVLAFALAAIATTFSPLPLLGLGPHGFYDRYLIVFLPWLMLLFVTMYPPGPSHRRDKVAPVTGTAALVAMAAFSIAATHDYIAVSRAHWAALNDVMRRYHVGPERIDGGFEFNGWYLYDDNYVSRPGKNWYWVMGDDYAVELRSLRSNYEKIAEYPVDWWLPWSSGQVVVQRRIIGTNLDPVPRVRTDEQFLRPNTSGRSPSN